MLIDRTNATTAWRYFMQDHLGSVEVVADQNGNLVEQLSYDIWGRRRNVNGTDATTPITALDDRGCCGRPETNPLGVQTKMWTTWR
jgi:hypothetical protein